MTKEYIDREVAIEAIRNDLPNIVNYRKADAMECLGTLPAADVAEVRHGTWKDVTFWRVAINPYQHTCELCGKSYYDHTRLNYPYCPYCGAKMDGKSGTKNG